MAKRAFYEQIIHVEGCLTLTYQRMNINGTTERSIARAHGTAPTASMVDKAETWRSWGMMWGNGVVEASSRLFSHSALPSNQKTNSSRRSSRNSTVEQNDIIAQRRKVTLDRTSAPLGREWDDSRRHVSNKMEDSTHGRFFDGQCSSRNRRWNEIILLDDEGNNHNCNTRYLPTFARLFSAFFYHLRYWRCKREGFHDVRY